MNEPILIVYLSGLEENPNMTVNPAFSQREHFTLFGDKKQVAQI